MTSSPRSRTALGGAALLALMGWSAQAWAHDFWIERRADAFVLRHGHRGRTALPLDAGKLRSLTCRKDGGAPEQLLRSATVAATEVVVQARCGAVSAHLDGGFWSLTPDGEKNLPKNRVPDAVKAWRSQQFAKWVDVASRLASQPIGDGMEIVPVTDLTQARAGDKATFRVLLEGKPLPGAMVAIGHKPLGETDDEGQFRVKIRAREVESIGVTFGRAVKMAEADAEVFEASLTFEVSR